MLCAGPWRPPTKCPTAGPQQAQEPKLFTDRSPTLWFRDRPNRLWFEGLYVSCLVLLSLYRGGNLAAKYWADLPRPMGLYTDQSRPCRLLDVRLGMICVTAGLGTWNFWEISKIVVVPIPNTAIVSSDTSNIPKYDLTIVWAYTYILSTRKYKYTHTYVHTDIHIYIHIYIYIYTYLHIDISTYLHIYIFIHSFLRGSSQGPNVKVFRREPAVI